MDLQNRAARHAVVVTPSDTVNLTRKATRGLFVGGAGNISVQMDGGNTVLFNGVLAGQLLPIQITRVNSTNTTATNIVALS